MFGITTSVSTTSKRLRLELLERLRAVAGGVDAAAVDLEDLGQRAADAEVVVDDRTRAPRAAGPARARASVRVRRSTMRAGPM